MLRGHRIARSLACCLRPLKTVCKPRYLHRFAAGEYVWIHCAGFSKTHWRWIPEAGELLRTYAGNLPAEDIIGRKSGDLVSLRTGHLARVTRPTLEEHILYCERTVTPIYPRDASVIISRLDLHAEPEDADPSPRLEILEAGTGMGGLTLHLARAMHAANPTASSEVRRIAREPFNTTSAKDTALLQEYKSQRRAVVHTIDVSSSYAAHASRVIGSFRNALYSPTIDQYVGNVSDWIRDEFKKRCPLAPFLHHVILDLPSAQQHLRTAALALHPDGMLVLFVPSISMVQEAFVRVQESGIPLVLDEVLEVGTNLSGGRQWNVELAQIRKLARDPGTASEERDLDDTTSDDLDQDSATNGPSETPADTFPVTTTPIGSNVLHVPTDVQPRPRREMSESPNTTVQSSRARPMPKIVRESALGMVARPRVVNMAGGGFLAFFRKSSGDIANEVRRIDWHRGKGDDTSWRKQKRTMLRQKRRKTEVEARNENNAENS